MTVLCARYYRIVNFLINIPFYLVEFILIHCQINTCNNIASVIESSVENVLEDLECGEAGENLYFLASEGNASSVFYFFIFYFCFDWILT